MDQDGTHVQFMSTKLQKYLCAEHGGGTIVVANRTKPLHWETFRVGSSTCPISISSIYMIHVL